MNKRERKDLVQKLLQEASDKGVRKGVTPNDMLDGMLVVYVLTRLTARTVEDPEVKNRTKQQILADVEKMVDYFVEILERQDTQVVKGPDLGQGDN